MTSTTSAALSSDEVSSTSHWCNLFPSRRELIAVMLNGARIGGAQAVHIEYQDQPGVIRFIDDGGLAVGPKTLAAVRTAIQSQPIAFDELRADILRIVAALAAGGQVKVCTSAHSVSLRSDPAFSIAISNPSGTAAEGVRFVFELLPHLHCDERTLRNELVEMVRGFPIPVTLNGSLIPRPFAISVRGFTAFAHGHYLRDEVALRNKHHIFLNGIEIEHADGQPTFIPDGFAVHLHPDIFCPVLPAMNELLGGELTLAFLRHELQRVTGTLEPAEAWWQP